MGGFVKRFNSTKYLLLAAYWHFYGYNDDCDCCSGERDAWWEFIVVKVGSHFAKYLGDSAKGLSCPCG